MARLEYVGGQQPPFAIDASEVYIGRGAGCALRVAGDTAAERHARLTVDGAGNVFIQDLDTQTGTLRNGEFVYGVQQLAEGDRIEVGGVAFVFRAAATAATGAAAATSATAGSAPASLRAAADERTRAPTELPPEVRAVLASREQASRGVSPPPGPPPRPSPLPPPPIQPAPAGIVVGTPEPEPDNFRTVQMAPADLEALGIDPATLPPITRPTPAPRPTVAPPAPPTPPADQAPAAAKRTMMGMPAPSLPKPPAPRPGSPPRPADAPLQPPAPSGIGYASTLQMSATPLASIPTAITPPPEKPTSPAAPAPAAPAPAAPMVASAPPMVASGAPMVAPAAPPPRTMQLDAPAPSATAAAVAAAAPAARPAGYTPPRKGPFGALSRALAFMGQIFRLALQHKALLQPLLWDAIVTTPIMAVFTLIAWFVHSPTLLWILLAVEAFLLYFVDYACNALTASLVNDYLTTGEATMRIAAPRVARSLRGIATFAAVSALLDVATTWARERHDYVARLVLRLVRALWTTATYVIMPALVIEGAPFSLALRRSKQLMDNDPTGVGAGIVAMSITSYLVALVFYPLAWLALRAGAHVHPALGLLFGMLVVNLYWSVSGWMKIAYATCFYLWACECERRQSADPAHAPLPLRYALDAG